MNYGWVQARGISAVSVSLFPLGRESLIREALFSAVSTVAPLLRSDKSTAARETSQSWPPWRTIMQKRKIDAREALKDIRNGLSDEELMEKYSLSAQGLQSLFRKLVESGLLTQYELDDRNPFHSRTVVLDLFRCPSCGMPQFEKFDVCPQCGVIVSRYVEQTRSIKRQISSSANPANLVKISVSLPSHLLKRLQLLGGDLSGNIVDAIEFWLDNPLRRR